MHPLFYLNFIFIIVNIILDTRTNKNIGKVYIRAFVKEVCK